jgi:hypothetical protein
MCFLVLLFIWESMKSLESKCIGIQTSIKALYTRFQTIYLSAALSKSNGIVISQILSIIKNQGITCLLIRSSGISLNL